MHKAWWIAAFFVVFVIGGIEAGLYLFGYPAESNDVEAWGRLASDLLVLIAVSWRLCVWAFGTKAATP